MGIASSRATSSATRSTPVCPPDQISSRDPGLSFSALLEGSERRRSTRGLDPVDRTDFRRGTRTDEVAFLGPQVEATLADRHGRVVDDGPRAGQERPLVADLAVSVEGDRVAAFDR